MQFQTIWQSSYTPPGFGHVEVVEKKSTRDRIFDYLTTHGPTERNEIVRGLSITPSTLRHSVANLGGLVEFEQTGSGRTRKSVYWIAGSPPPDDKRGAHHKVLEWIKVHPWTSAKDLPDDIYSQKHKFGCVNFLEAHNRLISRVRNGLKQYKAVV